MMRGCMYGLTVVACLFFFFSSRRRHTRSLRDWSSDVCSSDLLARPGQARDKAAPDRIGCEGKNDRNCWARLFRREDRVGRSEERREGKSVDLGGRRIIKKKKGNSMVWSVKFVHAYLNQIL